MEVTILKRRYPRTEDSYYCANNFADTSIPQKLELNIGNCKTLDDLAVRLINAFRKDFSLQSIDIIQYKESIIQYSPGELQTAEKLSDEEFNDFWKILKKHVMNAPAK